MSEISMSTTDFAALELEVNAALARASAAITTDPAQVAMYSAMFDRTGESGFYGPDAPVKGRGEQPTWEPNPAYMKSLEAIWDGEQAGSAQQLFSERGLALERPLYDMFFDSHEYEDSERNHRRVFHGHILQAPEGRPLTFFMLTVPHSHQQFELTTAPVIAISRALD
jgi:hypothetical protein